RSSRLPKHRRNRSSYLSHADHTSRALLANTGPRRCRRVIFRLEARMSRHTMSAVALAAVVFVAGGAAHAELSRNVINSFRGQLVISKDELPEGKNDKETIAKIKAAQVHELVGTAKSDVTAWHFHYSAFVAKSGATTLKMMFYADGKRYVADK